MSFICGMKDKKIEYASENVFHKGSEGQKCQMLKGKCPS